MQNRVNFVALKLNSQLFINACPGSVREESPLDTAESSTLAVTVFQRLAKTRAEMLALLHSISDFLLTWLTQNSFASAIS